jgi:hypothetical protein
VSITPAEALQQVAQEHLVEQEEINVHCDMPVVWASSWLASEMPLLRTLDLRAPAVHLRALGCLSKLTGLRSLHVRPANVDDDDVGTDIVTLPRLDLTSLSLRCSSVDGQAIDTGVCCGCFVPVCL